MALLSLSNNVTWNLIFAIFAASFGSAFQHGYNTGVLNPIRDLTTELIQKCKAGEEGCKFKVSDMNVIWGILVGIFCIGGMIGGLLVSYAAEQLGRKYALLANNFFVFLGACLMALETTVDSWVIFAAGRLVIGIACGLGAGLTPLYLQEIAPSSIEGAVGIVYQLILTMAILFSEIMGHKHVLGFAKGWPYLIALTVIPGIIQLVTLPHCPDSPKYLIIERDRLEKGRKGLAWLRGQIDNEEEIYRYRQEKEDERELGVVYLKTLFTRSDLRTPLIVSVMLMLAQQLCGINVIIYFSTTVFKSAGLSEQTSQYATIGMGVTNVLGAVISIFIIERVGRKSLLAFGFVGMLLSTGGLFLCLLRNLREDEPPNEMIGKLSIFFVLTFTVCFAVGPGPIPWFIVSELFTQQVRPLASSIAVAVNWLANFVVGLSFPSLNEKIGAYVFVIFIVFQAFFLAFILFVVEDKTKKEEPRRQQRPDPAPEEHDDKV